MWELSLLKVVVDGESIHYNLIAVYDLNTILAVLNSDTVLKALFIWKNFYIFGQDLKFSHKLTVCWASNTDQPAPYFKPTPQAHTWLLPLDCLLSRVYCYLQSLSSGLKQPEALCKYCRGPKCRLAIRDFVFLRSQVRNASLGHWFAKWPHNRLFRNKRRSRSWSIEFWKSSLTFTFSMVILHALMTG